MDAPLRHVVVPLCLTFALVLPAQVDETPPTFEVCVVGAIHAPWQFRFPGISPAHVRAALAKLQPDVIGVECNPEWFAKGIFHEVTYEAQGVAIPFAKRRNIPVHGIDWMDIRAWDRRRAAQARTRIRGIQMATERDRLLAPAQLGQQSPAYLEPYSELRQYFDQMDMGFAHINQIDDDKYAAQWLKGDPKAKGFGGRRNHEIAKRCVEVMRQHPGKRLVVVIGAGHKAVLDILLARVPGVRVLRLGRDIAAPTEAEIAAAETAADIVATLGHNIDGERSCFHRELIDVPRMRALIDKLSKADGHQQHAHYFAGRLALLTEDYAAAARHFAQIGDRFPAAPLYPFPMRHWRMVYDFDQALRIAKAELAIAQGRREPVAELLRGLGVEIELPDLPSDLFDRGAVVKEISAAAKGWSPNSPALRLVPRTLFLVAEQVAKPDLGLAAVTHKTVVDSSEPLCLELEVRARNRARGAIELYERDPASGHMTIIGTESFRTGPRWDVMRTAFQVRDTTRPVWIYVYLDAAVGTRFGVRHITIRKPNDVVIPPDWIPRRQAREYVRILRRG